MEAPYSHAPKCVSAVECDRCIAAASYLAHAVCPLLLASLFPFRLSFCLLRLPPALPSFSGVPDDYPTL